VKCKDLFAGDTLCYAVTLTFDSFTLNIRYTSSATWSKSAWDLSEIEQSPTYAHGLML